MIVSHDSLSYLAATHGWEMVCVTLLRLGHTGVTWYMDTYVSFPQLELIIFSLLTLLIQSFQFVCVLFTFQSVALANFIQIEGTLIIDF